MFDNNFHSYTFSVQGLGRKDRRYSGKVFASREAANEFMYKLCGKNNCRIDEVWNDHHDKTYICHDRNVRFFIQRQR